MKQGQLVLKFFLRLDRRRAQNSFYGWLSYTFSKSVTNSSLNQTLFNSTSFEQPHSVNLIAGYVWDANDLAIRFTLVSGFPYTPIVGSTQDMLAIERYSPTFAAPNSRRFPLNHRLDIRYTRKSTYSWGSIDWYVEFINLYYLLYVTDVLDRPTTQQQWNYNRPYAQGSNPAFNPDPASIIIPNFGVEIKF